MLRRKRFWLGLTISLTFLTVFLVRTDFGEIYDAFKVADYRLALAAVPLYFAGFWLRSLRWRLLLRPVGDVSTARLYPVVLIGLMTNNVVPGRIGELVRAYLVGQRESLSKSAALGTVAVDRIFDGLTLVAILAAVTAFSGAGAAVQGIGALTALVFAGGTAVLVALAFSPARARHLVLSLAAFLPDRVTARVENLIDAFLSGLVAIRSPMVMLQAALLSLASWLVEAAMYWLVGLAFDLDVGFHVYLLIAAAANLALTILPSPGGIGPFELATQRVLAFFSVGSAASSAYAIVLHVLLLGPVIIVGFSLLWLARLSLNDILGISRPPPAEPLPLTEGALE